MGGGAVIALAQWGKFRATAPRKIKLRSDLAPALYPGESLRHSTLFLIL